MKKVLLFVVAIIMGFSAQLAAQGMEDFTNFPETGSSYNDGTFSGLDGSIWTYTQCRGDIAITLPTPTLGKNRTPTSSIQSGLISGGIGVLSFDYMQAFSTNVNLDVYVNGVLITTVTSNNEVNIVKNSGDIVINVPGDFNLKFIQHDNNAGQVSIDNIVWTGYTTTALPEPTNYPENFSATPSPFSIILNWEDATTGAQLPQAYLIKASTSNNITAPLDGTPVADDIDLSDGSGAKNIAQGVETFSFTGLANNQVYYFSIYPYTNSGSLIDYKTDGTAPSASSTTPNLSLIHSQDFNDRTFGAWTTFSVTGDQQWTIDTIHGIENTPCARVSGYATTSNENEDWLISPTLNLANYTSEIIQFYSAKNYTGPDMQVMISTDYAGSGNPNLAYWENLDATLSPGGWAWTFSGNIDIANFASGNVYIGFKYTSTATESATWEVDDIKVWGHQEIGIEQPKNNLTIISPNPAREFVKVSVQHPCELLLYSLTGEKIIQTHITKGIHQISLQNYPSGIYILKLIPEGYPAEVFKLIIR
jgi:hypothetical protein